MSIAIFSASMLGYSSTPLSMNEQFLKAIKPAWGAAPDLTDYKMTPVTGLERNELAKFEAMTAPTPMKLSFFDPKVAKSMEEKRKEAEKFGLAHFTSKEETLKWLNEKSGWSFDSLEAVNMCGLAKECRMAMKTDPPLIDQNATLVAVTPENYPSSAIARCHTHPDDKGNFEAFCHSGGEMKATLYGVEVKTDNGIRGHGVVTCHEHDDGTKQCHTLAHGVTLIKKEVWCETHACGSA